jgi:predicted metal-binding membrane protein
MESATLQRPRPLPPATQVVLIGLLIVAAILAWTVTDDRMSGMDAGPGTDLGDLGWFIGVWVVMMAAMMFPSIWPMVLTYRRVDESRKARGKPTGAIAVPAFVGGYLVAWTGAGLIFYAVVELFRSADIGFLAWDEAGQYIAGGVILAAAIYQLTPLKDACLRRCRSPLMFILNSWRPGNVGALRMGVEHGLWCVGCCWGLMAALLALGVMSIGWMALIAALIAVEKLLPWRALASGIVTASLFVLAIGLLAAPEDVPGLTVPGSPEAEQAMEAMGMEGGTMEEEAVPAEDDAMPGGEDAMPAEKDAMPAHEGGMDDEMQMP